MSDLTEPEVVLVIGSGRSGTSLFTELMTRIGYHAPQPQVDASEANPQGFNEPLWLVLFQQALLDSVCVRTSDARPSAWQLTAQVAKRPDTVSELREWVARQLKVSDRLVIKDPRSVWFMPAWAAALEQLQITPRVVTLLREPRSVVISKRQWYDVEDSTASSLAGWTNLMLQSEVVSRQFPRVFVSYSELFRDVEAVIEQVFETLQMSLQSGGRHQLGQVINPSLRRSDGSATDLHGVPMELQSLADECWSVMKNNLVSPESMATRVDDLRRRYDAYYQGCEDVTQSTLIAAAAAAHPSEPQQKRRPPLRTLKQRIAGIAQRMTTRRQ